MQIPTPQDKFAEFDARLSRIEGIVEQIDKRLSSLETRIANLETGQRWIVGLLLYNSHCQRRRGPHNLFDAFQIMEIP